MRFINKKCINIKVEKMNNLVKNDIYALFISIESIFFFICFRNLTYFVKESISSQLIAISFLFVNLCHQGF